MQQKVDGGGARQKYKAKRDNRQRHRFRKRIVAKSRGFIDGYD